MSKLIENEQKTKKKEEAIYYDDYINVKFREFVNANSNDDKKENIRIELAKVCGKSVSTIRRCESGYSTLKKYNEIKAFADYTGFDFNKLLEAVGNKKVKQKETTKRPVPDDLVINGVQLHNEESYNTLCGHTFIKGKDLFPGRDNFLVFLDYMISEEKFINAMSDKAQVLLDEFKKDISNNKIPKEEITKIEQCANYDDFDDLFSKGELDRRLSKLITDKKIRNIVRAFITKYFYDNLK